MYLPTGVLFAVDATAVEGPYSSIPLIPHLLIFLFLIYLIVLTILTLSFHTVNLGSSGLRISRIILGCMSYGSKRWQEWNLEGDEAMEHIKHAYVSLSSIYIPSIFSLGFLWVEGGNIAMY